MGFLGTGQGWKCDWETGLKTVNDTVFPDFYLFIYSVEFVERYFQSHMKSRWQYSELGFSASFHSLRCEENHSLKITLLFGCCSVATYTSHGKMDGGKEYIVYQHILGAFSTTTKCVWEMRHIKNVKDAKSCSLAIHNTRRKRVRREENKTERKEGNK